MLTKSDLRRLPLVLVASLLIPAAPTLASENLREPLARIASAVAKVLQDRRADSIAIGEFTGPPTFGSAAGPGIRKILAEEFSKLGIREKKIGASIGIQGKYLVHQDQPTIAGVEKGPPNLRLLASLVDANGQILTELNVDVNVNVGGEETKTRIAKGTVAVDATGTLSDFKGGGSLAEALGATVEITPGGFTSTETVISSFQKPTATLLANETGVATSPSSPFMMEILVDDRPRALVLEDGQPFVQLEKGESFQIRFTNRAPYDVAVSFLLDGVSTYAFSDIRETRGSRRGEPKYTKWIVPRQKHLVVKGWHRNNEEVDKFLVTDFGESAAAKLGSSTGLGTITASVRRTWQAGEQRPREEPNFTGIGIGFGERDTQQVQEDTAKREYGQVRTVITVRYAKPEIE